MEDLSGLSWNTQPTKPSQSLSSHYPSTLHATPSPNISRQPSPLSAQQSGNGTGNGNRATSVPKPVGNDSFSSLLSSNASKQTTSLTLQERQRQLLAEKTGHTLGEKQNNGQTYNANDADFWEGLGSGRGTPAPADTKQEPGNDEEDILAAFNASAPVDSSSHFPPPASGNDAFGKVPTTKSQRQPKSQIRQDAPSIASEDDDDPFGLGQMSGPRSSAPLSQPAHADADDNDVLGLLGRPVSETSRSELPPAMEDGFAPDSDTNPSDRALAELVDMGFAPQKAKQALSHTSTGADVQGAVGWLLNQAHHESRSKSRTGDGGDDTSRTGNSSQRVEPSNAVSDASPAWMRRENGASRSDSRSPSNAQKDSAQYASELGATFFKSANAIWRTGQKRVQKVIAEYQYEGDKSQPRWMRNAHGQEQSDVISSTSAVPNAERRATPTQQSNVTDEAVLLETRRSPPRPRSAKPAKPNSTEARNEPTSRERPPLVQNEVLPERPSSRSAQLHSQGPNSRPQIAAPKPVQRLSRQAVEEESTQVYTSPARRRKPQTAKPADTEPTLDIFAAEQPPIPSKQPSSTSTRPSRPAVPAQPRPKAPVRQSPQVSPNVLSTSASYRQKGTESFKRGDYAEAHTHYTNALTPMPDGHPITIVLRCNRALTNIKIGDPKAAIVDADSAIAIVGGSQGEGETISLGGDEGEKPMKEFYGKALMRKAEALEHMEKWTDAGKVWQQAVEAGVGGSVSIQGRNRCEKAAGKRGDDPVSSASAARKTVPRPRPVPPKKSAMDDLNGGGHESEAVKRLRAQNEATAAASDEQFALADTVEARLIEWKGGKSDNLRALLASLDKVLWADAGWNKVGMSDLVMPNRVKIVYMKAIGKVHPDKIPQNATTEQRMVSASVFATLNEAWDKFKRDNGL